MRNPGRQIVFRFKQFEISNCKSAMKVGTDGVLLGAWAFNEISGEQCRKNVNILDVGCGTGLLSLMMAQRFDSAKITGIDIDQDAYDETVANFSGSCWSNRLAVECCDFADFAIGCESGFFDMIICNPPFFTTGALSPDNSRCIARHEGSLNLECLISFSSGLLREGGRLAFVTAAENRKRIDFLAALGHMDVTRVCMVKTSASKPPRRVMCEMVKPAGEVKTDSGSDTILTIHDTYGLYTPEYISLVESFYLNL